MKTSREASAVDYLRVRSVTAWHAAPSFTWLQALYTALRWAVTGDTDCWFWSHFHRLGPCVSNCGQLADTIPAGLGQAPLAEHHYAEYLNPLAHIHADYQQIIEAVAGIGACPFVLRMEVSNGSLAGGLLEVTGCGFIHMMARGGHDDLRRGLRPSTQDCLLCEDRRALLSSAEFGQQTGTCYV